MHQKFKSKTLRTAVTLAVISQSMLVSQGVFAQDAKLEEIVITSTRRETNVQDTPLAV